MEKQYILFNTPKAFWFSVFCGFLMFVCAVIASVYLKLEMQQFAIFAFLFSGAVIFTAFKIDSKK